MAEPVVAGRTPLAADVAAGKSYWWCESGRSQQQPFCADSHAGGRFTPLEYRAAAGGSVSFLGCAHSHAAPRRAGTHRTR
jgi:CDGSH iron-sulfur domain-containing protein 3